MLNILSGLKSVSPKGPGVDSPKLSRDFRMGGPGANSTSIATTQNLQGADLVKQIQMRMQQRDIKSPGFNAYAKEVFDTQGNPTKTMQQYEKEFPDPMKRLFGQIEPLPDLGINDSKFIGINPDSITSESGPLATSTPGENPYALNNPSNPSNQLNVTPPEIPVSMQQPLSGFEEINNLSETGTVPRPAYNRPGNNSFGNPLMGGINNLSGFENTMGGNNVFQNPFPGFQSNQQSFNNNQELSSYVDNIVNGRLKDIFGGIMGIFK